jgi:methyl-accepting chemotaxis protein
MVDYTSSNYNIQDHIKEIDSYNNILGDRIEKLSEKVNRNNDGIDMLGVGQAARQLEAQRLMRLLEEVVEENGSSIAENNNFIDANKTNINRLAALLQHTADLVSQYMRSSGQPASTGGRRRRKRTNKKRKKRKKRRRSRRKKKRKTKKRRMKGG